MLLKLSFVANAYNSSTQKSEAIGFNMLQANLLSMASSRAAGNTYHNSFS